MTDTFSAQATTIGGCGDYELTVTPGDEGSGLAPVLIVPLEVDEDGRLVSDLDAILRDHGFRTIRTDIEGVPSQPEHWTGTDFGAVATAVTR